MVNLDGIKSRYRHVEGFLDERGRRLFAANEALPLGYGGGMATAAATGLARSTITVLLRHAVDAVIATVVSLPMTACPQDHWE